jgi:hypothetical protein
VRDAALAAAVVAVRELAAAVRPVALMVADADHQWHGGHERLRLRVEPAGALSLEGQTEDWRALRL